MRPLLALVGALLLAGCSSVRVEGLRDSEAPREPYYEEHEGLVAPQHDQAYAVEVDASATLVNATLHLVPRSSGVAPGAPAAPPAAPMVAPAQLTLAVLDAAGRAVASAVVDPAHPDVTLLVKEITTPGAWTVRVSGTGASGTVEGQDYGASYVLSIEVLYG